MKIHPLADSRDSSIPPMESCPVAIRAYTHYEEPEGDDDPWPATRQEMKPDWMIVFDVETTTDAAQRARFGAYEVWWRDAVKKKGLFYDPSALTKAEEHELRNFADSEGLSVHTIRDFVDSVFYRYAFLRRGMIVGFNLPFDISRLAIDHATARAKDMEDGFSFKLSEKRYLPRILIEHRNQRSAFIRFAASEGQRDSKSERNRGEKTAPRTGNFVDVKTIGAALTGSSHSLDSLAKLLGVTQKIKNVEHGAPIEPNYIRYCIQDVRATRECFVKLRRDYEQHGLTRTPIRKIYSEASIGKAYFQQMGILPWQEVQPDFPKWLVGVIMSTYHGGRSEVRWRRVVMPGLYCDFTSMYPTVCTNMGLSRFMVANGVDYRESVDETRELLQTVRLADLQKPEFWKRLTTLVFVEPEADLFPVRAKYEELQQSHIEREKHSEPQYTIGLNYLTSKIGFWFTLADCIASTILTGKPPKIIRALTFTPKDTQPNLRPVSIMGKDEFRIDPRIDDFPKRLIELRAEVNAQKKKAFGAEYDRLDAEQLALKILANATTYGVFVELIPEGLGAVKTLQCFGADASGFPVRSRKFERPGRYFHPLLATFITGAARLMLAIAERRLVDEGLRWILCDTDSMMFGQPPGMQKEEFDRRAKAVRDWFEPLNPYDVPLELFKVEDENYRKIGDKKVPEPLLCYAVSAKRYVLFNQGDDGEPIVRRASGHGLGALRKPYDDTRDEPHSRKPPSEFPKPLVALKGVPRWQHDYWRRVARLALDGRDNDASAADHPSFDVPAASSYHATKPEILRWFKRYNEGKPYEQQVRPFGFLLSFQPNPLHAFRRKRRKGGKPFRPIAPYDQNIEMALTRSFDRANPESREPISGKDLRTLRQLLANYHMHSEAKFHSGKLSDRGETLRRHIRVEPADLRYIGKESNDWEQQFHFFNVDDDALQEYGPIPSATAHLLDQLRAADRKYGRRPLAKASGISPRYISSILSSAAKNLSSRMLARLIRGIARLEAAEREQAARTRKLVAWLREECTRLPLAEVASRLTYDSKNLRKVEKGLRLPSELLMEKMDALRTRQMEDRT